MHHTSKATFIERHRPATRLDLIRSHIAASMIGRTVDLLVSRGKTAHGVVSAVQLEGGAPKLIVAGSRYNLNQVLTVTPTTLN